MTVHIIFRNFVEIVSGPHHATWRGTSIKTGDRTIKMKLDRNIPQAFSTLEIKVRVTVIYRDQPQTCYMCGDMEHETKRLHQRVVCKKRTTPHSSRTYRQDKTSFLPGGGGNVRLREEGEKGERKKKERKEKEPVMTRTPDGKRKDVSSPEEQPPPERFHFMPQAIAVYKSPKRPKSLWTLTEYGQRITIT